MKITKIELDRTNREAWRWILEPTTGTGYCGANLKVTHFGPPEQFGNHHLLFTTDIKNDRSNPTERKLDTVGGSEATADRYSYAVSLQSHWTLLRWLVDYQGCHSNRDALSGWEPRRGDWPT